MTKHSLRLNPAEVLELSTSWQDEEQARGAMAAASRRTAAALFTILERHDLEEHAGITWRLRTEGDEVLICGEVPDTPDKAKPEKLEGAALCAVEGHELAAAGPAPNNLWICVRDGCNYQECHHQRMPEEQAAAEELCKAMGSHKDKHGVCQRCGHILKDAVGGPGSKLTPAQVKRGRRKARKGAAAKAATL